MTMHVLLATKLKAQLVAHGIEQVQVEPAVTNMVYVQFTDPVLAHKKPLPHCRQKGIMLFKCSAHASSDSFECKPSAYIDLIVDRVLFVG